MFYIYEKYFLHKCVVIEWFIERLFEVIPHKSYINTDWNVLHSILMNNACDERLIGHSREHTFHRVSLATYLQSR